MRRESSRPLAVDRLDLRNTTDLLADRLRDAPEHVAFARRCTSGLVDVTTSDFHDFCTGIARGLITEGLEPGDRVLVMAPTRYEWALADFAIWLAGGVVVPVYETSAPTQVAAIITETSPRLAIVGGAPHGEVVAKAAPELPRWTMDPGERDLTELAASGSAVSDADIDERRGLAGLDDVATIVYTSGTTAGQKGVRITHGNLVRLVVNVAHEYSSFINDSATTIVALPLAHILARALQLAAVAVGMKVVHEPDRTKVVATFAEVRPTFMVVVPMLLSRIRQAVRDKATASRIGWLFRAAEATAVSWAKVAEARQDSTKVKPGLVLRLRHWLFDRLFYRKIRALLGGRLEWLLSGAAPLDPTLSRFFWGAGIPVIEGYGLTETTAPATGLRPDDLRPGSVGPPMPGTTILISDDSEVLVKGIGVFAGYHDPSLDPDAFVDGFHRTGDTGSLDDQGRLTIVGRLKNLIVTDSGKNVAPEPWEESVGLSPLVAHAVMLGEGQSHLTALLVLDRDATLAWAGRRGLTDLTESLAPVAPGRVRAVDHPALRERLQRPVDRANAAVSRAEQVRDFTAILADVAPGSPLLTPTMKLRRAEVLSAAAAEVTNLQERKNR